VVGEVSDEERTQVVKAISQAWAEGCPVASRPAEIATIAIRRWLSSERRGLRPSDRGARVRDLAKGLVSHFESEPALVGPLLRDYEYLAERIAAALDSRAGG
jgi:hypothetical protein